MASIDSCQGLDAVQQAGMPLFANIILSFCLSYLFGLLGVSIWGWVEALHVPEGLLHFARTGRVAPARAAIACGVSPNVRNYLGETPLLLAAANGHGEMVKLLLLHGANPALPDMFGQTAVSVALANGHTDIVDVFSSSTLHGDLSLPLTPTPWRPNARRWLMVCITLGASLMMGLTYFSLERPITAEQFLRMAEAKQIQDVRKVSNLLEGEVKDRFQSGRDPVWLPARKFFVRKSDDRAVDEEVREHARAINLNHDSIRAGTTIFYSGTWPGDWIVIVMLAWPTVFLAIPLWFVIGLQTHYPFLALSSSRRSVVPGEPSPGPSTTGTGSAAR
jgi:hypothetical protein